MGWTKEQFVEFCNKCGVDPKKALSEGKVSVRKPHVTGATLASIAARQIRKNNAVKAIHKVQDSFREHDKAVALEKEACGQVEGMAPVAPSFRISIIGLRVRPIDPDNFAAGCKGLVDGLVASGIVPADDWETCEITAVQRRVNDWAKEGTVIEITSGLDIA